MMVRCSVCGKITRGRSTSRHGYFDTDCSERYPRKHYDKNGNICSGYTEYAEWIDSEIVANK